MIDEERLKEIEARAAAATEGPWKWTYARRGRGRPRTRIESLADVGKENPLGYGYLGLSIANRTFLENARQDIPDLVAALREARQLLGALANVGPSVIELRPHERQWLCCFGAFAFDGVEPVGHKPGCPWLLAKQYLEPPTQQPFRAIESHQEPR